VRRGENLVAGQRDTLQHPDQEDPMPVAPLRLIRRCFEFARQEEYWTVPPETRGIYVLYRRRRSPL